MYCFYFDASALAKRYTVEIGSETIDFPFDSVHPLRLQCLILGAIEVFWMCLRKRNDGRITQIQFSHAIRNLENEVIRAHSDFDLIPISDSLVFNAIPLIESYSLNSTDALVLRSALDLNVHLNTTNDILVLVVSDQRLLKAAQQEGLLVFNPETDLQQTLTEWITHT